jgi:hypothetical protein
MSNQPTTPNAMGSTSDATTTPVATIGIEPTFCNHISELNPRVKQWANQNVIPGESSKGLSGEKMDGKVLEGGCGGGGETAGRRRGAQERQRRGSNHNWQNYDEVVGWVGWFSGR